MLSNTISREAAIMAYNQVFYVMGIFLLIASALMLLLKQPAPRPLTQNRSRRERWGSHSKTGQKARFSWLPAGQPAREAAIRTGPRSSCS
jgi:hypothetical protein